LKSDPRSLLLSTIHCLEVVLQAKNIHTIKSLRHQSL